MKGSFLSQLSRTLFATGFMLALATAGATGAPALMSGKVTDNAGNPMSGVTVVDESTNKGTVTDANGVFEIQAEPGAILVLNMLGYETQRLNTEQKSRFTVILRDNVTDLEKIVVIGYGSMKKGEVTSAISNVSPENFQKGLVKSPEQLLQGKVAGLQVVNTTGDPVVGLQLRIRGTNSLEGNASPLIVIDGIPGGSMTAISAEDIESFDVLKDGSAAAIYGSQGSNGVIIITTKKPKASAGTLEYNGSFAAETISKKPDLLTASDYRRLQDDPAFYQLVDNGTSTDWIDEITRVGISQNHYLSLKGGSQASNYVASVDYRKREGVINKTDRESITARMALNHNMFDNKLRFQLNFNDSYVTQTRVWYNAFLSAMLNNPTSPVYNEDGSYNDATANLQPFNPVAEINEEDDLEGYNQLMTNGKVTFTPVKGLNLSVMGALQRFDRMENKSNTFKHISTTMNGDNGNVWNWATNSLQKTIETTADYSYSCMGHNATILAGYSWQDTDNKGMYQWAKNFPTDIFGPWNIQTSDDIKEGKTDMTSYRNGDRFISFFTRLTYNYKERYMLMASYRRDGSSRFGANNKWGDFPAVSAGWRISGEEFMQDVKFVNDLKLRAGYGVTGTLINTGYQSLYLLNYGAYFLSGDDWVRGVGPYQNPNPNLKWETKREINLGLDFTLFNRLNGSVDLYNRKTNDLLGSFTVPVPPNLVPTMTANAGNLENKGIEVALSANVIRNREMNLTLSANFSANVNKITALGDDVYTKEYMYTGATGSPIQTNTHIVRKGEPVGNFWGFKTLGLDEYGKWLIADKNGNPIPLASGSDADKRVIGNGLPSKFFGFNASFDYKGFDLYVSARGAFDYEILNSHRMMWETTSRAGNGNLPKSVLKKPYGSESYVTDAPGMQSHYLENGNYVKIDNLSLGYTFKLGKQEVIKRLRVYGAIYNLYTFTKYTGLDPEVNMLGLAPGVEGANGGELYPTCRTYTFGVNISF